MAFVGVEHDVSRGPDDRWPRDLGGGCARGIRDSAAQAGPQGPCEACSAQAWICRHQRDQHEAISPRVRVPESTPPAAHLLPQPPPPCQVEPNTKLFPAVFVLPTHQNVIQFELGKQKVSAVMRPAEAGGAASRRGRAGRRRPWKLGTLTHVACPQNIMPLSAAMFLSERKNPTPQCPPRLEVQMLTPISWSRMPNRFLQVDTRRAGERLGWAVQCQEPLTMMALHIPEENRSGPALSRCWDWGGYFCSPLGSGSTSVPCRHYHRIPDNTPEVPRPTLLSPDNTPGGLRSISVDPRPTSGDPTPACNEYLDHRQHPRIPRLTSQASKPI